MNKLTIFLRLRNVLLMLAVLFLYSCDCFDCVTNGLLINGGETKTIIFDACEEGNAQTISVTSSSPWHLNGALPEWFHMEPSSGPGGYTQVKIWFTKPVAGGLPFPASFILSSDGGDQAKLIITMKPIVSLVMVSIPAGTYNMGITEGDPLDANDPTDLVTNERPRHSVTVRAFSMSDAEVTNAQYCAFLNASGKTPVSPGLYNNHGGDDVTWFSLLDEEQAQIQYNTTTSRWEPQTKAVIGGSDPISLANYPMVWVSWYGAKAYCDFYCFRMPTEEEWEYAARGGVNNQIYAGSATNDISGLQSVAWYKDNSNSNGSSKNYLNLVGYNPVPNDFGTHPVRMKNKNGFNLYDMSGNVWEWTASPFTKDYNSSSLPIDARRMYRGGSWEYSSTYARVSERGSEELGDRYEDIGFRVCF